MHLKIQTNLAGMLAEVNLIVLATAVIEGRCLLKIRVVSTTKFQLLSLTEIPCREKFWRNFNNNLCPISSILD
jgi:hypothetical protein